MRNVYVDIARQCVTDRVRFCAFGRGYETGMDCIGLVIYVGIKVGVLPSGFNVTGYTMQPDGKWLLENSRRMLKTELKVHELEPGSIVILRHVKSDSAHHFGIVAVDAFDRKTIIHAAMGPHGRVVEQPMRLGRDFEFVAGFKFEVR